MYVVFSKFLSYSGRMSGFMGFRMSSLRYYESSRLPFGNPSPDAQRMLFDRLEFACDQYIADARLFKIGSFVIYNKIRHKAVPEVTRLKEACISRNGIVDAIRALGLSRSHGRHRDVILIQIAEEVLRVHGYSDTGDSKVSSVISP
jgi:hypothetical protein